MNNKGSTAIIVIVIIAILAAAGGTWYAMYKTGKLKEQAAARDKEIGTLNAKLNAIEALRYE